MDEQDHSQQLRQHDQHAYIPPKATDRRAPCPGVNTLANHGYLPRDGKDIGLFKLMGALRHGYNITWIHSLFIAGTAMFLCGHGFFRRRINLDDLAVHGKLEHDASLIHRDTPIGTKRAPNDVDPELFKELLKYPAPGHGMSLHDFARLRRDRELLLPRPLEGWIKSVACSEPVIAWFVMRDEASGEIPIERLKQFFGEERLPDGWARPKQPIRLFQSLGVVFSMTESVTKMIDASRKLD
ncbi:hypothetical protein HGRIS_007084 [Hohenbuehelia grisea]|uniref:Heme haloperoxidase family profile domain-containing protein n=1 Tax=Hohenbuehelia grisea TaxID=104357 RepID=A0ABR3JAZ6_9AGAR